MEVKDELFWFWPKNRTVGILCYFVCFVYFVDRSPAFLTEVLVAVSLTVSFQGEI